MNKPKKTTYGINDIDGERLVFVKATPENFKKGGWVELKSNKETTKTKSN